MTSLGLIGHDGVDDIEDRFYTWLTMNEVTGEYFTGRDIAKIKRGLRPIIILVLTDPDSIDLDKLSAQLAIIHSRVRHTVTGEPIDAAAWDVAGRLLIHSLGVEFAPLEEHDQVLELAAKVYSLLRPAIVQA
jgi:hypothetical protein